MTWNTFRRSACQTWTEAAVCVCVCRVASGSACSVSANPRLVSHKNLLPESMNPCHALTRSLNARTFDVCNNLLTASSQKTLPTRWAACAIASTCLDWQNQRQGDTQRADLWNNQEFLVGTSPVKNRTLWMFLRRVYKGFCVLNSKGGAFISILKTDVNVCLFGTSHTGLDSCLEPHENATFYDSHTVTLNMLRDNSCSIIQLRCFVAS